MSIVKNTLTLLATPLLWLLCIIPQALRWRIAEWVAVRKSAPNKRKQRIIQINLTQAAERLSFSDIPKIQHAYNQWHYRALLDYPSLWFNSKKHLYAHSQTFGLEHIEAAKKAQQPIIFLLAHSVYLDFAPMILSQHHPVYGSYKSNRNAVIDWLIKRSRLRFVSHAIERDEGLRPLLKQSNPEHGMIFLADEDLGEKNAVFAPFFGRQKATLNTPARLAKLTGALCLPCFCFYDENSQRYTLQIDAPLQHFPSNNAQADAEQFNQRLEGLIEHAPTQYMWKLQLFKTLLKGDQPIYPDKQNKQPQQG